MKDKIIIVVISVIFLVIGLLCGSFFNFSFDLKNDISIENNFNMENDIEIHNNINTDKEIPSEENSNEYENDNVNSDGEEVLSEISNLFSEIFPLSIFPFIFIFSFLSFGLQLFFRLMR